MSPEQLRSSKDADARSDIWSMGVILYEMVTGHQPFEGSTVAELVTQILASDPVPPTVRRPDLPIKLESVILKCLTKELTNRYQSIGDLAAALSQFGSPGTQYPTPPSATVDSTVNISVASIALPRSSASAPPTEVAPTKTTWERVNSIPLGKHSKMIVLALCIVVLTALFVLGKLIVPAPLPNSALSGHSTPGTSNASLIGTGLAQIVIEPQSEPKQVPAMGQAIGADSQAKAEHAVSRKPVVPGAASGSPKPAAFSVPSAMASSAPGLAHPFDDRK
jgi:serine/threonine protein kinase